MQGTHERANLRLPTVFFFSFAISYSFFLEVGGCHVISRYCYCVTRI